MRKASAPARFRNQAFTLYGTSPIRCEVNSAKQKKNPSHFKVARIFLLFRSTPQSELLCFLRGCECVDTSTSDSAESRRAVSIEARLHYASKNPYLKNKCSEWSLFLVHALRISPRLSIDTNEVSFVNKHRHVNSCASFKGHSI